MLSQRKVGRSTAWPLRCRCEQAVRTTAYCSWPPVEATCCNYYSSRPCWSREQRCWVTFRQSDARSLLARERVTWAHFPTNRNVPNALRNFWLGRTVARERPSAVITTGAGVSVPFALAARLRGIPVVYVESMARITTPSLTARATSHRTPFWCNGPSCFDTSHARAATGVSLIFVSLGTHQAAFGRVIDLVSGALQESDGSARTARKHARAGRLAQLGLARGYAVRRCRPLDLHRRCGGLSRRRGQ